MNEHGKREAKLAAAPFAILFKERGGAIFVTTSRTTVLPTQYTLKGVPSRGRPDGKHKARSH